MYSSHSTALRLINLDEYYHMLIHHRSHFRWRTWMTVWQNRTNWRMRRRKERPMRSCVALHNRGRLNEQSSILPSRWPWRSFGASFMAVQYLICLIFSFCDPFRSVSWRLCDSSCVTFYRCIIFLYLHRAISASRSFGYLTFLSLVFRDFCIEYSNAGKTTDGCSRIGKCRSEYTRPRGEWRSGRLLSVSAA